MRGQRDISAKNIVDEIVDIRVYVLGRLEFIIKVGPKFGPPSQNSNVSPKLDIITMVGTPCISTVSSLVTDWGLPQDQGFEEETLKAGIWWQCLLH